MKAWHNSWMIVLVVAVGLGGCSSGEEATTPPTASINGGATDNPAASTASHSTNAAGDSSAEAAPDVDPMHPVVLIETSLGSIKVELDREKAPVTVNNFLAYADSGQYDGTIFHQVIKDFIVLGGGYDEQFTEKPTNVAIRNEANNGLSNVRGSIAMARQPDVIASSTSQFFINVVDNASLDYASDDAAGYGYCVFGKVIEGMDVVDKIANTQVTDRDGFESTPAEAVVVTAVSRSR